MTVGVIGDYSFHWMGEDDPTEVWNIRWNGEFLDWDYEAGDESETSPPDHVYDDCDEWFRVMMKTFQVPEQFNESEYIYCYVSYDPEGGTEARLEGIDKKGHEFIYYIEEEDGSFV